MPYKVCTFCGKASYSSSEATEIRWLCPHCDQDISDVPSQKTRPQISSQETEG